MVNEPLGAGLTAQRPNPRHRRSILLALTEEGRGVIDQVIAREQALVEAIGADIDAEDARTALSVVLALVEKLKRHAEKEEG
jgi:DNA-binding MarR family transcriptional regulator